MRGASRVLNGVPATSPLDHVLDLNHAAFFGRVIDMGAINHQVQLLLGDHLPPIRLPPQWPGWRKLEPEDIVHVSRRESRRYIWRKSVLDAEPREEIMITNEEIAMVEQELDAYVLD